MLTKAGIYWAAYVCSSFYQYDSFSIIAFITCITSLTSTEPCLIDTSVTVGKNRSWKHCFWCHVNSLRLMAVFLFILLIAFFVQELLIFISILITMHSGPCAVTSYFVLVLTVLPYFISLYHEVISCACYRDEVLWCRSLWYAGTFCSHLKKFVILHLESRLPVGSFVHFNAVFGDSYWGLTVSSETRNRPVNTDSQRAICSHLGWIIQALEDPQIIIFYTITESFLWTKFWSHLSL